MASVSEEVYKEVKKAHLQRGALYEDDEFPAQPSSIGKDVGSVEWKRPKEILEDMRLSLKPVFIRNDATRADFDQGQLGNCWFIAASACLAVSGNRKLFWNVIQPTHQSFDEDEYAGVFLFRFWRFGKWVNVIIDDRLPTVNGHLVFARNMEEPNEFWAPLMEKAYAKVNGSYGILHGGFMNDALVDFTGGTSQRYKLHEDPPKDLYDILYRAVRSHCLMGSAIESAKLERETSLSNGLLRGHAYSITAVTEVKTTDGRSHKLIRLRNPWGQKEYTGDWSDKSDKWKKVDRNEKIEVEFKRLEDGEFWMSYDDWLKNFEVLDLCYLSPEEFLDPLDFDEDKSRWYETRFEGKWEKGVSAGGCGNPPNQALYWKNPQFHIRLTEQNRDEFDDCQMLVSLLEVDSKRHESISMGLDLYKLKEGRTRHPGRLAGRRELKKTTDTGSYSPLREITLRFRGEPGNYVLIPSTFYPDKEASFLLRVFTEKPSKRPPPGSRIDSFDDLSSSSYPDVDIF